MPMSGCKATTILGNGVKRTRFDTYTVYSNWDENSPYSGGGDTLPPGGVITQANDGSVTAGVFTAYNGQALSDGDHYLIEVRSPDAIQVFQPIGADTPLSIQVDPAWASTIVTAYHYDGTPISAAVDGTLANGQVTFTYASALSGETVGSYRLTPKK